MMKLRSPSRRYEAGGIQEKKKKKKRLVIFHLISNIPQYIVDSL